MDYSVPSFESESLLDLASHEENVLLKQTKKKDKDTLPTFKCVLDSLLSFHTFGVSAGGFQVFFR